MADNKVLLIILALFIPPLAVYLKTNDCGKDVLINIVLCLFFYLPAILHAFWKQPLLTFKQQQQQQNHLRMPDYQRIVTVLGVVAIAIVGYYLYKHGELGNPKEMISEAVKDGKGAAEAAAKPASGAAKAPAKAPSPK